MSTCVDGLQVIECTPNEPTEADDDCDGFDDDCDGAVDGCGAAGEDCDGADEDWRQIGIPHGVLADINNTATGKYGWHFNVVRDTKYAMITFENEDDALWFRLTIKQD